MLSSSGLLTTMASARVASALSASAVERVPKRKSAFAGLHADDDREAKAADQKGYMTAFS